MGGRVIREEGRGTHVKMGHMAGTHLTVIEDTVTSHGKQNGAGQNDI